MLLPGLNVSTFANTVQGRSATKRFNFTMGVLPTVLRMFSWIFMRREGTVVRLVWFLTRRTRRTRRFSWTLYVPFALYVVPLYVNRIAFAGAMRDTYMLGITNASTQTNSTPTFSATMGPRERSTGTLST